MLEKHALLDRKSVERLQDGQVVAKLLDSRTDSELAILGAVVIDVPRTYFLSQFRDINNFMKGSEILQVEKLGMPPTVVDLQNLTLDAADIGALKRCQPGDCAVKLSAAMMAQIAAGIDGSSTNARVNAAFRVSLVDYLKRYLAGGNQALACYADKGPPICVAKVLSELLGETSLLQEYAPVLAQHLAGSQQPQEPGLESFLYWSVDKLGPLKPILSVTQVTIYSKEQEGSRRSFIASKQIYASHYFQASLGLTVLLDVGQNSVLMLYVNRSRVEGLDGWLGAVKRAIVRHNLRSGMLKEAAGIRMRLERSYQQSGRKR
jgi:hypothetical protein